MILPVAATGPFSCSFLSMGCARERSGDCNSTMSTGSTIVCASNALRAGVLRSSRLSQASAEDVSEVLVCYALRVYESPSTLQPNRVTS